MDVEFAKKILICFLEVKMFILYFEDIIYKK